MEYHQLASPLSQHEYAEYFESFKKISNEWEQTLEWIQNIYVKNLPLMNNFSILSVGSGTGDFDFQFIQAIKPKVKTLEYTTLEPNEFFGQKIKDRIASYPYDDVLFETSSIPFEGFDTKKRFDLVHFSHSLYYIPNREQAILRALGLIQANGRVLIIHQTPWGINQIQQKFLKQVKGGEKEMFSSRELQEILDHNHITYSCDIIDSHLDVSDCLQPDSESGQNLLSFFLECKVHQLMPAIKQEIIDYIYNLSFEARGRRFIFHPAALFLLING